jgi:hypothetical protein
MHRSQVITTYIAHFVIAFAAAATWTAVLAFAKRLGA